MKRFFLILIFLVAVLLRIMFPESYGVGFDQVQILDNVNKILDGNLTLVGPRTGPANMFTGPLIYYLTTPFVYFFGEMATVFLLPVLISFITGIFLYFLSKDYLSQKSALILTSIWALSPFIISSDRVLWNPNFTLLATILIFIPLLKQKTDKKTHLFLFLGSFLSFQAHFSGFLLILLGVMSILYLKRSWKLIFSMALGLFFSIIPTIIFDLRHNFLNLKGLVYFLKHGEGFDLFFVFSDIFNNVITMTKIFGKIFVFDNFNTGFLIFVGILLILISISVEKSKKLNLSFLWLLIISIAYSFYSGEKPDYYFLISIPALLFISLNILKNINSKILLIIFLFLSANSIFSLVNLYQDNNGMTIKNIKEIKKIVAETKVKNIVYDIERGLDFGVKYVLSDVEMVEDGNTIHIGYPNNLNFNGIIHVSDIAVWIDERSEYRNYISANRYFLETRFDYFLYKDLYPRNSFKDNDFYKILVNEKVVGKLSVFKEPENSEEWIGECLQLKDSKNFEWLEVSEEVFFRYASGFCLKSEMSLEDLQKSSIRIF